jgi:tRNA pseudouridine55 synthase
MPVYIIDKPLGFSSHDVVDKARKLLKTKAVGHAGTLDPLATGVLVILSQEATKLSSFLSEAEKHYLAWISFGASTASLDAEGPIEKTADISRLRKKHIQAALPPFLQLGEQLPPQYSAIKQGGVKGYEAARKGEALDLPARAAKYFEVRLLDFQKTREFLPTAFSLTPKGGWQANERGLKVSLPASLGAFPTALFYLRVQAGTYVRAFARDLGTALGLPAHLSALVRTRAGQFGLEQAIQLENLPQSKGISLSEALPYPLVTLSDEEVARVRLGQRLALRFEGRVSLVSQDKTLVAVAESEQGRMKLLRVWM